MGQDFGTIIVGAGPAAIGPLVSAHQAQCLDEVLASRLLFIDRSDRFGGGSLGRYLIHSDTSADTLLESLDHGDPRVLAYVKASPIVAEVERYRGGSLPLRIVGAYLSTLGEALLDLCRRHSASDFWPRSAVRDIRRTPDGRWSTTVTRPGGVEQTVTADRVVVACGGVQHRDRILAAPIARGFTLADNGLGDRVMMSDELLSDGGPAAVARRLGGRPAGRITIVGASHSAMCCAWALLNLGGHDFAPGAITLLHSHPFPVFYPTPDDARREGYTAFDDDDVCPVTGRLFRLAGLRMKTRELAIRVLRIGQAEPEPRVRLLPYDRGALPTDAVRAALTDADVIVTAFGYRPNNPPFFDADGERIALLSDEPDRPLPMVDTQCRILDAAGRPLPNAYGTGLASGFKYNGELGGEPSFVGQANSLWLYQNGIGDLLRNRMVTPPIPAVGPAIRAHRVAS